MGGTAVSNVGSGLSHGAQAVNSSINTTTEWFGKWLHAVAHGLTSTFATSEAHTTDSKKESCQGTYKSKPDDNFMFAAIYPDDHLMAIQEGDDDDYDDDDLLVIIIGITIRTASTVGVSTKTTVTMKRVVVL